MTNSTYYPRVYSDAAPNNGGNRWNGIFTSPPPVSVAFRSHPVLGLYKGRGGDMTIKTAKSDFRPLFYVATNRGFSSKPSVAIHNGASSSQPVLMSADFRFFSGKTDINLGEFGRFVLDRGGFLNSAIVVFNVAVPSTGQIERFEWNKSYKGLQCVRCATGEAVAAFTYSGIFRKEIGKMSFFAVNRRWGEIGVAAEMLILLSLCVLIENRRRD